MIHPVISALAERNMTRARILNQITARRRPAVPPPSAPTCQAGAAGGCGRARCVRNDPCACPCSLSALPPIVCLCGSTRFHDQFRSANLRLTLDGQIVLSIGCDTKSDQDLIAASEFGTDPAALKTRLDELHLRKIDLADYILVLNVGGYTGPSTRREIDYARATGKPVRYLEPPGPAPDEWACRRCGDAWYGTPPGTQACPDGCHPAAARPTPEETRK